MENKLTESTEEDLVAEFYLIFFDENKHIFEVKGITEYPSIGVLIYVLKELKEKYDDIEDKSMDILSKEQFGELQKEGA